jgi:glycosyl-4,4'-diaponeurosporenoate acyltransferase
MNTSIVVALNVVLWPVIHVAVSLAGIRCPDRWFAPAHPAFRPRRWEDHGRFYEAVVAIRAWKDLLPDGADVLGGSFAKKHLASYDPEYLARFCRETCRGEAVHWITMAFGPLFFAWNPPWAGWTMMAYAIVANMPCILVQRYNRARLVRMLARDRVA